MFGLIRYYVFRFNGMYVLVMDNGDAPLGSNVIPIFSGCAMLLNVQISEILAAM